MKKIYIHTCPYTHIEIRTRKTNIQVIRLEISKQKPAKDCTALRSTYGISVGLISHTFTGESMGGDTGESFTAHIAVGGSSMGAGIPVVHSGEVVHTVLGRLET